MNTDKHGYESPWIAAGVVGCFLLLCVLLAFGQDFQTTGNASFTVTASDEGEWPRVLNVEVKVIESPDYERLENARKELHAAEEAIRQKFGEYSGPCPRAAAPGTLTCPAICVTVSTEVEIRGRQVVITKRDHGVCL